MPRKRLLPIRVYVSPSGIVYEMYGSWQWRRPIGKAVRYYDRNHVVKYLSLGKTYSLRRSSRFSFLREYGYYESNYVENVFLQRKVMGLDNYFRAHYAYALYFEHSYSYKLIAAQNPLLPLRCGKQISAKLIAENVEKPYFDWHGVVIPVENTIYADACRRKYGR